MLHFPEVYYKIKNTTLLVLCLLFSFAAMAQSPQLRFFHVGLEDGLPDNSIHAICEDKYGFMWFGTADGLVRFDGIDMEVYRANDKDSTSIVANAVHAIFEDSEGRLWIGTKGGGVCRYKRETNNFHNYRVAVNDSTAFPNDGVLDIAEDEDGNLWFAGANHLVMKPKGKDVFRVNLHDRIANGISRLNFDENGALWFGTIGGGLGVYNRKTNTSELFLREEGKTQLHIWDFYFFGDTILVCDEHSGIHYFSRSRKKMVGTRQQGEYSLNDPSVFAMTVASDGNTWLGTNKGGLNLFSRDGKWHYYTTENSAISSNTIKVIYEDSNGIVWLGNYNTGIDYFHPKSTGFRGYSANNTTNEPMRTENILSLIEDKNGTLWVGTDNGGLLRMKKDMSGCEVFTTKNSDIPGDAILALDEDKYGNIWLTTYTGGISCYSPTKGTFTNYNTEHGLTYSSVWNIRWESDSVIWLGTNGAGLDKYNPITKKAKNYHFVSGDSNTLMNNSVIAITPTQKGNYWVGHWSGISLFDPTTEKFKNYTHSDADKSSISINAARHVYEASDGKIWISTHGGGIDVFDPNTQKFEHIREADGLLSDICLGMLADNNNQLWVSSNKGLSRIDMLTHKIKNYREEDGIVSNQFGINAFVEKNDGQLVFGGNKGIVTFHPDSLTGTTTQPKLNFIDFKLSNVSVDVNSPGSPLRKHISVANSIQLQPHQTVFSIEFRAVSFYLPEKIRYQYRLNGFDKDWVNAGNTPKATYTNLDPGEYTFEFRATDSNDEWMQQTRSIRLEVVPAWWELRWVQLLFVVVFLLSGYLYYRYRMHRIAVEKKQLEQIVQQRTQELKTLNAELNSHNEEIAAQRDKLEHAYEDIAKHNEQTKASIRYAKTIQHAMLPSSDHFLEAKFKHSIIYRPKDIVSGDFFWFSHEQISQDVGYSFVAVVDCTGHGVPGAFMSMIGNRLLNEIVRVRNIHEPAQILDELNRGVIDELNQESSDNKDGMDVCLCRFEHRGGNTKSLVYAGAGRPLYHYNTKTGEVETVKGSRKKIGGISRNKQSKTAFSQNEVLFQNEDVFYLSSDGLVDQNNKQRKKIGTPVLVDWIKENAHQNLDRQIELLNKRLEQHMNGAKQRDDITLWAMQLRKAEPKA